MQPLVLPIGRHVDGVSPEVAVGRNILAEKKTPKNNTPQVVYGSPYSRKLNAFTSKSAAQQF
jgi:hypothetical protein